MLPALITTLNTSVAVHRLVDEPLRINPRRSGAQEAASRAITEEANGVDCKTLRCSKKYTEYGRRSGGHDPTAIPLALDYCSHRRQDLAVSTVVVAQGTLCLDNAHPPQL